MVLFFILCDFYQTILISIPISSEQSLQPLQVYVHGSRILSFSIMYSVTWNLNEKLWRKLMLTQQQQKINQLKLKPKSRQFFILQCFFSFARFLFLHFKKTQEYRKVLRFRDLPYSLNLQKCRNIKRLVDIGQAIIVALTKICFQNKLSRKRKRFAIYLTSKKTTERVRCKFFVICETDCIEISPTTLQNIHVQKLEHS